VLDLAGAPERYLSAARKVGQLAPGHAPATLPIDTYAIRSG
jgi:hypothetical protein